MVTVEDPSDDMIRLRDYVDTVNALKLLECFSCFEKVRSGFTKEMASEAKEKMKLGKKQTRKVYEIIRLHWTKKAGPLNDNNVEYKNYRVDVKKRLNIPYQVIFFASSRALRKMTDSNAVNNSNNSKCRSAIILH